MELFYGQPWSMSSYNLQYSAPFMSLHANMDGTIAGVYTSVTKEAETQHSNRGAQLQGRGGS